MHHEPPLPPTRRPRRTAADRLREALLALAGGHGEILRHSEEPWASITFAGSRHSLSLQFEGAEAVEAGEALIAALPDHEFTIPGQLVAEASITGAQTTLLPTPQLEVECMVLMLEES